MKKILPLFLIISLFAVSTAFAQMESMKSKASTEGEKAQPTVKGDTVYVNNKICAVSRTQMKDEDLGKFESKVIYAGADPRYQKYKGKTLIFNQCCAMCQKSFPKKWSENADEILQFHGL